MKGAPVIEGELCDEVDSTAQLLGSFAAELRLGDIPSLVRDRARDMIINGVAASLAGSTTMAVRILYQHAVNAGYGPCSVAGHVVGVGACQAARANGAACHVLEYDELVLRRSNHPTNVVLPVVLALAETEQLDGRAVLEAFVAGCEIATKLGAADDIDALLPRLARLGWHLEGVAGVVGAAAAAAKLYGLDARCTATALAIAVSHACGVQANYGSFTKALHCGNAAMNGIAAAQLARDGFTASTDAFDADQGFFGCYGQGIRAQPGALRPALGHPFDIEDPGVGLKRYPSGSSTHTAIDAALAIRGLDAFEQRRLKQVEVHCVPRAGLELQAFATPESGSQARYSVHYCVATALVRGTPTLTDFTDDAVQDQRIRELLPRIVVTWDEPATPDLPRPCTMVATLDNGDAVTHRQLHASGHPKNPFGDDELRTKFLTCALGVLPDDQSRQLLDRLADLVNQPSVAEVVALLRPPPEYATSAPTHATGGAGSS